MTATRAPEPAPRPPAPLRVELEAPLRIEGAREAHVLTVGPVVPPAGGGLVLLGAVLTVQLGPATSRVVLRWRVADPRTDAEREPRSQVARFEGNGPLRILAALDKDEAPAGPGRVYELTAQLEGEGLLAHVASAAARAGALSPVGQAWGLELVDKLAAAAAAVDLAGK